MDLSGFRKTCLARYGGSRWLGEDPVFNYAVLNEFINEAHRQIAEETLYYEQTQTYNLPASSGGISTVSLDCNIIEVQTKTVRILVGTEWRKLRWREPELIYDTYGPLENTSTGTPEEFWFRNSDTLDAVRILELYPGATSAVTSGVKLRAYVYPSLMTADTHTPAMQPAEHTAIIPGVCRRMAELERSAGRGDAPVEMWMRKEMDEIQRIRRGVERYRRPGPREVRQRSYDEWI